MGFRITTWNGEFSPAATEVFALTLIVYLVNGIRSVINPRFAIGIAL
jgi:hypothetical protein